MLDQRSFESIDDAELQEMLLGTWIAIATVADELAVRGQIDRNTLLARLSQAEHSYGHPDGRGRAIGMIGLLFATFGEAAEDIRVTSLKLM